MRTSHIVYKVPDGKLVRIEMDYDDKIVNISISGDFFMHPEDAIEKIEDALIGIELKEETIFDAVVKVAAEEKIDFFGVDAASLTRAILICGGKVETN
jgi:lipoate-protein ligase A